MVMRNLQFFQLGGEDQGVLFWGFEQPGLSLELSASHLQELGYGWGDAPEET
jgi:hypothetical protein